MRYKASSFFYRSVVVQELVVMGSQLSSFGRALYNSKRREFLGRDGARWGK